MVNPNAGKRPRADGLREVLGVLEAGGVDVEVAETSAGVTAADIARRAVGEGRDAVIAAGGDGTVQLVARELLATDVVLGILPYGTFMNIAKGLRIPLDPLEAARVLARGHVGHVDVGEVNGHVFFESAGVGLDAEVFGAARAAQRGRWRGAWRRAVRWGTQGSHRVTIRGERSEVTYPTLQLLVLNSPYYTWSFPIVGGDMSDGLLEVAVFPRMGRVALLRSLLRLARGGRFDAPPIVLREPSVRIEADAPLPIQADTRPAGTLPATFRCRRGALRVYVPAAAAVD